MKESEFIQDNKKRWQEFEAEVKGKSFNPERLTNHYIEVLDDLSYARTHYKNRIVRSYLNGVAQLLALRIYKTQKGTLRGILKFWKTDLPLVMYEARKDLLLSFLLFGVAVLIGVFSSIYDPDFVRFILGDAYVDMTLSNIEAGDPVAVYKDQGMSDMFFGITINNLWVAVKTFVAGALAGVGTFLILLSNGVMLGSFQHMFFAHGVGIESMLAIWQHGTIEISSIVLAGAAGITLSRGLLFPGTYARLDAFRISGRKGMIIMLGLMPLLVYSGFIEAFITRLTDVGSGIRVFSILLMAAFVVLYFVWYPRKVAKTKSLAEELNLSLQPLKGQHYSDHEIIGNAHILAELLDRFKERRAVWGTVLIGIILSLGAMLGLQGRDVMYDVGLDTQVVMVWDMVHTQGDLSRLLIGGVALLGGCFIAVYLFAVRYGADVRKPMVLGRMVAPLIPITTVTALCLSSLYTALLLPLWLPFSGLLSAYWVMRIAQDEVGVPFATLLSASIRRLLGLSALLIVGGSLFMLFVNTYAVHMLTSLFTSIIPDTLVKPVYVVLIVRGGLAVGIPTVFFSLIFGGAMLSIHSIIERVTARQLIKKVEEAFPADHRTQESVNLLNRKKLRAS